MSQNIVVDSSVVVKWFVAEEAKTSPAVQILNFFKEGSYLFITPDLLFYEVGNVFLKKWPGELKKIQTTFARLWQLPWYLMPLRQSLLTRTLEMSYQYQITFYDALFVSSAEQSDALFITADEKLLAKIQIFPFAKSLQNFT